LTFFFYYYYTLITTKTPQAATLVDVFVKYKLYENITTLESSDISFLSTQPIKGELHAE